LTTVVAALGGMSSSLFFTLLLDEIGTRATLGTLAVVRLIALATASALTIHPHNLAKRSTDIVSWRFFEDPVFTCLFLVNLVHLLTLAIPMAFGPLFAASIGVSLTHASYLLVINSGAGIPARLGAGALADMVGHQNTLLIATILFAAAPWALWLLSALTNSVGLFIGMSVRHGLSNGVFAIAIIQCRMSSLAPGCTSPKLARVEVGEMRIGGAEGVSSDHLSRHC
jgi:hypothetical protein